MLSIMEPKRTTEEVEKLEKVESINRKNTGKLNSVNNSKSNCKAKKGAKTKVIKKGIKELVNGKYKNNT